MSYRTVLAMALPLRTFSETSVTDDEGLLTSGGGAIRRKRLTRVNLSLIVPRLSKSATEGTWVVVSPTDLIRKGWDRLAHT